MKKEPYLEPLGSPLDEDYFRDYRVEFINMTAEKDPRGLRLKVVLIELPHFEDPLYMPYTGARW